MKLFIIRQNLAVESGVAAESLEEQCFGLYAELDPAEQTSRSSSLVALLRIVKEPGLVVQLLFSQEAERGRSTQIVSHIGTSCTYLLCLYFGPPTTAVLLCFSKF